MIESLHHDSADAVQRRQYARTDYVARVFMMPLAGGAPRKCVTLNVSGGGLLVRGLPQDAIGDELRFDLALHASEPRISGTCRVMRQTPEGLRGVQFTSIDEEDRSRLIAFAWEHERAQRDRRGR